ncbi:heterodisulfide reductase subunit A [Candidatus Frackibacter sp. WG12]|uniref:CoB--CoM heterodisulfide reductase iron-sulfur subunit A family protein n=2 Tax=Candidatus Frackibacter TaxID=2017975 RepID=UPI00087F214E|nr:MULTISPECIES: CoB--CoM heterodisulfide reductase iron-sulfur subunit A family protein [unclassified Candidatus Frackibacter]SDC77572.1 heterodisulfide reductase subunit A [Candidatus Frackibacter sp. WG11]SEM90560.1 heterodisulfide reductase subunit A [Candidatus Frackibacter sp. WG12]
MTEEARVGVYVCHCGSNIADKVDVEDVRDYAKDLPNVVLSRDYKYMCSDPGQDLLKKDIAEHNLDRIVVASCSPRMHEPTFRYALEDGGLNGYFLEMANIREHCSWVTEDEGEATEKSKALVSSAVNRVPYHEPLEEKEVDINPATLVVGGGISGIQAALKIADSGQEVYLVEKKPSIGGKMAKLDKTFPTLDCAACILTPKMVEVARKEEVHLLTNSQVTEVSGYIGNFDVTVTETPRYVDLDDCTSCGDCSEVCPITTEDEFEEGLVDRKAIYRSFPQAVPNSYLIDGDTCVKCGKCVEVCEAKAIDLEMGPQEHQIEVGNIIMATGYEVFDPSGAAQWGYGLYDNVVTGLEFERLTNASGPTGGKVKLEDGSEPEAVAVLHCIGSRDENYKKYCSRVCCMSSVKFSHLAKEKTDAEVYEFYIDMRTFGKQYEEFYNRVQKEGINFIRGKGSEIIKRDDKLIVRAENTLIGEFVEIPVDMVVLNTALIPQASQTEVGQTFGIQTSNDGFFLESHIKLDPFRTATEGIYLAGCCQSPKDIPDSVAQGSGAAAEVLSVITKGKVSVSPISAHVNEEICSGCKVCIPLCPYSAISYDEELGACTVNEVLCEGCGTCVGGCPSGALRVRNFDNEQIFAQIEGVCGA